MYVKEPLSMKKGEIFSGTLSCVPNKVTKFCFFAF